MPTGYTSIIADGGSFKEFALQCARNFGALISLRDQSIGAKIPDVIGMDTFLLDQLHNAKEDLTKFEKFSNEEWILLMEKDYDENLKYYHEEMTRKTELKLRYQSALQSAEQYVPPSPDHEEYKKFMIEQLKECIKWECNFSYPVLPVKKPMEEYKQEVLEYAKREIEYYTKRWEDGLNKCKENTEWIQLLKQSLENE